MGILRRGKGPDAAPSDAGADETDVEDVPVGPTGRALHSVGAYFEAAFRRFGINFTGYLLTTALCGLPTAVLIAVFRNTALSGELMGVLLSLAYALGFVAVVRR